jgi:hypothetical protein
MRKLFAAALFSGSVLLGTVVGFVAAHAADGCGPGCHSTVSGACVVDGWGFLPRGISNECPAGARATPPCPRGFVFKYKACFPS